MKMKTQFELDEEDEKVLLEVKKVKRKDVSLLNKKKLSRDELDDLFLVVEEGGDDEEV